MIILTNMLVGSACSVVTGFVGGAACLSHMVRSGVVALVNDSVTTAADG